MAKTKYIKRFKIQKDSETEKQKYWKTERQIEINKILKNRRTERQKYCKTERQKKTEKWRQKSRKTERQKHIKANNREIEIQKGRQKDKQKKNFKTPVPSSSDWTRLWASQPAGSVKQKVKKKKNSEISFLT